VQPKDIEPECLLRGIYKYYGIELKATPYNSLVLGKLDMPIALSLALRKRLG
jgi:hypothetical protein